jgi:hypothetical protein
VIIPFSVLVRNTIYYLDKHLIIELLHVLFSVAPINPPLVF